MTDHRPTRIAGLDRVTAALATVTCLAFAAGIAAITRSTGITLAACASLAIGLVLVLNILPRKT
ncbi:hypothetical protein ACFVMC_26225 [Nocardia sp. NPDC127579]|uniref:hypothetical protein n=1 Tax=Nocardia sp. NPDC127579 TaxID=3345402 RepID=UPI003630958C